MRSLSRRSGERSVRAFWRVALRSSVRVVVGDHAVEFGEGEGDCLFVAEGCAVGGELGEALLAELREEPALIGPVTGTLDLATALGDGTVTVDGDPAVLGWLVALLVPGDPNFAIITP